MLRYILRAYGHAARDIDNTAALAYLFDQAIPEQYARNLLSLAESRCRLQFTCDNLSNTPRPVIRTIVDSRLTVEWRDQGERHEIVQTPETAAADSGTFRALSGVTGEEADTDEVPILKPHHAKKHCKHIGRTERAHPCPFEQDVHNNEHDFCRCCAECQTECRHDI